MTLTKISRRAFCCALGTLITSTCMTTAHAQGVLAPQILDRSLVSLGDTARLQRVLAKAQRGEKVVLAFIGGSITEGATTSAKEKRYVEVIGQWWRTTFPQTRIDVVNAGIGATSSNFGAMRLQRDVLSKKPDLILVEFAVNDRSSDDSTQSYEGLIRQALSAEGQPAVLLLFMVRKDGSNAQETFAKVGSHYHLPMVSYRDALWPEIEAGRTTWEALSPDAVHPNDRGHHYAAQMVNAAVGKVLATLPKGAGSTQTTPLPSPFSTVLYERATLFTGTDLKPLLNNGWTFESPANPKSHGWKATVPGSVIEFEIPGTTLFFQYWKIKGPMGKAQVSIDGSPAGEHDAWFSETWGGYNFMQSLAKNLAPGPHRLRIELLPEKNPSSTGTEFRITGLGSVGQ